MEFAQQFFEKEIRCGFEISPMMKRAWAAELEVLQVVAEICDRNGLQYYADWGTLLGAVRHQGFIPWDDDIDICLKREDYMELIRILPRELPYGFVMAGMYAETERLRQAALCLNVRVIADEEQWDFNDYMKRFHGFPYQRIGIDIFPLDYMPVDKELLEIQTQMIVYGRMILQYWDVYQENGELDAHLANLEELCSVSIPRDVGTDNFIRKLVDSVAALYHENEADELVEYQYYVTGSSKPMRKEWYQNGVLLPFESIEIAAPLFYHEVLTAQFGDYSIPDMDFRGHGYPFYGSMEEALIEQIRAVGFMGTVEEFCQQVSSGKWRV